MTKVNKINTLATTKYLKLYDAEYTNKVGENRNWTIASRKPIEKINNRFFKGEEDKIDAVVIIPKHIEKDKLVLIKQFRVPINDYIIEFPAGLIDGDEDIKEAVKRELKEETGLELLDINIEKTKNKTYLSPGMTDESVAMVYCSCKGEISSDDLEDDEDIEVLLLDKEELKELLKSNFKIDVKAYLGIQNFLIED
ncbi:NUDIX hydrolase [Clostridium sp.]|uniref:NUDIX hydrolase n=1 Tax=Clostridium sp. TaxID=1506 RepID=UPI0026396D94|nr:NUDIX hydrolase [Clostridium sp.]